MDQIATQVGLTGPALYRHFRNKHDLLVEVIDAQLQRLAATVATAQAQEGAKARIDALLGGLEDLALDGTHAYLWRREQAHLPSNAREASKRQVSSIHASVSAMIAADRSELSHQNARFLAWLLLALFGSSNAYRSTLERARSARSLSNLALAILSFTPSTESEQPRSDWTPYRPPPAARRERVIESAVKLFSERGFHDVSVEDIAADAQIATTTVYQLFSSKADVLHAVISRGAEGAAYLTAHRLAFVCDEAACLQTIVDTYAELACGPHGRLYKIVAADLIYLPEEARRGVRRTQREYIESWSRPLKKLRPELSDAQTGVLTQATVALIGEMTEIPGAMQRPDIQTDVTRLAVLMLLQTARR